MNTTPGPWIVTTRRGTIRTNFNGLNLISIETAQEYPIAIAGWCKADEAESLANAALISIAPEMLEALIAIQEAAQMDMLDAESIEKMISDVFAKLANEAGA